MHLTAFVFCFIYALIRNDSVGAIKENEVEDYYWRDYKGIIPKDALPGGRNSHGKTTYIGQVLHQNQLIPAKIDSEEKKVTYEWGYVEYVAYINIKILCTNNQAEFEWVNTGNQHINTITDKNFIAAGYEAGTTLYIGRKMLEDELALGKVINGSTQATLNTTKDGKGTQHGVFQVLAYKGTKKGEHETGQSIDTRHRSRVEIPEQNAKTQLLL